MIDWLLTTPLAALTDELQEFRVLVECAECDEFDEISVIISTPSGQSFLPKVIPSENGFLVQYIPQESGTYSVSVLLNSVFIPESPFTVDVLPSATTPDISEICWLVRAYGPGLTHGTVNRVAQFIVDAKAAKYAGRLSVLVDGPSEAKLECRNNNDGTCSVAYLPTRAGIYIVSILLDGYHINSSPFTAIINTGICLRLLNVYIPCGNNWTTASARD